MKIGKHNLPAPVYSTDVFLAAVLEELVKLNATMEQLTKRASTAATAKDAVQQQALIAGAKGKRK